MSLFGFWLVPESLVTSIEARLARIEATQRRHFDALTQQGEKMSQEIIDALNAAKTKLFGGLDRLSGEVREMAEKLQIVARP